MVRLDLLREWRDLSADPPDPATDPRRAKMLAVLTNYAADAMTFEPEPGDTRD